MHRNIWGKVKNGFQSTFKNEDHKKEAKESIAQLAKFGCLYYFTNEYIIDVTTCIGPSMWPTFNFVGDVVLMDKTILLYKKLERGDVVVAKSATKASETVCKRVRGLAGDTVLVPADSSPFYDGHATRLVVPEGHVWLEGDNPLNSSDSRYYGPIPASMVKGRVFLKIWPSLEWVSNMPPHAEDDIFSDKIKRSGDPNWEKEVANRDQKRTLIEYMEKDSNDVENNLKTEGARNELIRKEVAKLEEERRAAEEHQMYLEMIRIRAAQQHRAEEEARRIAKVGSELATDVAKFIEQLNGEDADKKESKTEKNHTEVEPAVVIREILESAPNSRVTEPLKVATHSEGKSTDRTRAQQELPTAQGTKNTQSQFVK